MRLMLITLVLASLPLAARGADISLRRQATMSNSIVRLGDIADITSTDEAEKNELAAVPLLPAPAPGTQLVLDIAKLRELLSFAGVDIRTLQIRGSQNIAISTPAIEVETPQPQSKPLASPIGSAVRVAPTRPDRQATAEHIAAAITAYLRKQTNHDLWNVTVTPDNDLVDLDWHFGAQIVVSGGQAPYAGRQRFDLSGIGSEKHVRAFAAVDRVETVAFAMRQIEAGDFVRATDVELRPYVGNTPGQAAMSLESVISKEAIQAIRPGAMVLNSQLRSPRLVRKGERVSVRARAGGVTVHTYATAQQDGSMGDLIAVQALEGKERYSARVSGLRELEVFAGGTSAVEVAAAR
jgi:flagella basal body P-ring formation protein FlgA